jgi:hypothetical protein
VLWLALLGAVGWGLHALDEHYADRADALAGATPHVEWLDLPAHLTSDGDYADVIRRLDEQLHWYAASDGAPLPEAAPNDPQLCARVYAIVDDNPWVRSVRRVVRRSDNAIVIEADFRKPFTYVGTPSNAYLIDREGCVLRIEAPLRPGETSAVLPLTGVSGPAPQEGKYWTGEAVEAGLDLIEYLARADLEGRLPYRGQMTAVDVSHYQPLIHCGLRINTVYSHLTWGRAIGFEGPYDASPEERLASLGGYYASTGTLPRDPTDLQSPDWLEIVANSQ